MLAARLARCAASIRLGGKARLLQIAQDLVPIVVHRPVVANIGFVAGAATFSSTAYSLQPLSASSHFSR